MNQTLEIELHLPLAWEPLETGPVQVDNQAAFLLVNSFPEAPATRPDEEADASELQRIEQKLDLVVQLLMPLLRDKQPVPRAHKIKLSSEYMAWRAQPVPVKEQLLKLELYLQPRVPYPLTLVARVEEVDGEWVRAVFEDLSESDADALQRWIFRYHRRQIAQERQRR